MDISKFLTLTFRNLLIQKALTADTLVCISLTKLLCLTFLGYLRLELRDSQCKHLALMEMLARCIKNNLRWKLRQKMKEIAVPVDEPYRRLVVDYLNLVFGNTKQSEEYWDGVLKEDLRVNFPKSLSEEELSSSYSLKKAPLYVQRLRPFFVTCLSPVTGLMTTTCSLFLNESQQCLVCHGDSEPPELRISWCTSSGSSSRLLMSLYELSFGYFSPQGNAF